MSATRAVLAGAMVMFPGLAYAHTTEVPHGHPHLMDLSAGASLIAVSLFAVSVTLLVVARRAAARRRK